MRHLPPYLVDLPLKRSPVQVACLAGFLFLLVGSVWTLLTEPWILNQEGIVSVQGVRWRAWLGLLLSTVVIGLLTWSLSRRVFSRLNDEVKMRERLYEIIDALPDPAAVRDLKGRYVIWNHAAEDYYGITQDEVLGKTPSQVYPDDVARSIVVGDRLAAENGLHEIEVLRLPPLLGKPVRIVSVRISAIRSLDEQGRLRGVVSIAHDITAFEAQRHQLQREDARLRMALKASGDGVWDWDLESDSTTYSEGFLRLLRYEGDDFRRDFLFRNRLHPQDREQAIAQVHHCLATGSSFECRYRMLCFDDQYRAFWGRGEELVDEFGRRHFIGLLTEAHEDFTPMGAPTPESLLFESPLQGVLITDGQFNILRANRALCHFLGAGAEELIGTSAVRLLSYSEHTSADYMAMQKVLAERTHWQGLLRIRRVDGQPLDVLATVSAIRPAAGGEVRHFVAVFNDASRLPAQWTARSAEEP